VKNYTKGKNAKARGLDEQVQPEGQKEKRVRGCRERIDVARVQWDMQSPVGSGPICRYSRGV
jgi:hypothetical protein